MFTSEQYHAIMAKDRAGILAMIDESPSITLLPASKQGRYLIGTAKNDRAICLAWGDEVEGRVTMEVMEQAYEEIARASLAVPFLFFCRTCLVVSPDLFAYMQIPYVFEYGEILPNAAYTEFAWASSVGETVVTAKEIPLRLSPARSPHVCYRPA